MTGVTSARCRSSRPQGAGLAELERHDGHAILRDQGDLQSALVHDLLAQSHGIRTIARRPGWGRHTVQRYARAATWQELVDGRWQGPRPSKLDAFKPHLQQRFQQGCTNASQLHREITALGFVGSYAPVRDLKGTESLDPPVKQPVRTRG